MSREDFYRALRQAERFLRRRTLVSTGSPSFHPGMLTGQMPQTALWLCPGSVEAYRPSDFEDQAPEVQARLRSEVEEFRDLASQMTFPPTPEEAQRGQTLLDSIVSTAREIVLSEWTESVHAVIEQAEAWCATREWPSRRYETNLEERLLGDYTLPKLLFQVVDARIELMPAARFVPGASGMMELRLVPSYDAVRIVRGLTGWWVRLEEGETADAVKTLTWNEHGFEEAVGWLRLQG